MDIIMTVLRHVTATMESEMILQTPHYVHLDRSFMFNAKNLVNALVRKRYVEFDSIYD